MSRTVPLFMEIGTLHPSSILEVGVYCGETALIILLQALRFQARVQYFGIDLFEASPEEELDPIGAHSMEAVQRLLKSTGADVHLHKGNSRELLPLLVQEKQLPLMDLILIDGGHSCETVENDFNWCSQLMHAHSVMYLDDYWNTQQGGCRQLVDRLQQESDYRVEVLEPFDVYLGDPRGAEVNGRQNTLLVNMVRITRND